MQRVLVSILMASVAAIIAAGCGTSADLNGEAGTPASVLGRTATADTLGSTATADTPAPKAAADKPAAAQQQNSNSEPLTGAIFTTTENGLTVNGNIYDDCCDVYLNGGPPPNAPCTAAGLPDGTYYFQVTDPSGSVLLSSDPVERRIFRVEGGVIVEYLGGASGACDHDLGTGKCPGSITIQLMPFDSTPNPGDVYKVWVTRVSDYDPNNPQSSFGFLPSKSKTDNFKCEQKKKCDIECKLFPVKKTGELCGQVTGGCPPLTCTATVSDPTWIVTSCTVTDGEIKVLYEEGEQCCVEFTVVVKDCKDCETTCKIKVNCKDCKEVCDSCDWCLEECKKKCYGDKTCEEQCDWECKDPCEACDKCIE